MLLYEELPLQNYFGSAVLELNHIKLLCEAVRLKMVYAIHFLIKLVANKY